MRLHERARRIGPAGSVRARDASDVEKADVFESDGRLDPDANPGRQRLSKADQPPDGDHADHPAEIDAHAICYRRGALGQAAKREPSCQTGIEGTGHAKARAQVEPVDDGRAQRRIMQAEGARIRGGIAECRGPGVHGLHDGPYLQEEREGPQASFSGWVCGCALRGGGGLVPPAPEGRAAPVPRDVAHLVAGVPSPCGEDDREGCRERDPLHDPEHAPAGRVKQAGAPCSPPFDSPPTSMHTSVTLRVASRGLASYSRTSLAMARDPRTPG